tara:strand:+ start:1172 stop:1882 length:711 start_codon:yes stop_codon:yes gene_type:complete
MQYYSNDEMFDDLFEQALQDKTKSPKRPNNIRKVVQDGGVSKRINKGYTRYTAQMTMADGRRIQVNKSTKAEAEAALEELREMKMNGYSIQQGLAWRDKLKKYPKIYSESIYSKSDPRVVKKLKNLQIHQTLKADCLEGPRSGMHKASECRRWYRFRENAKDWRKRNGWNFWLDIKCFDGIVHAYRYDRDLVFNENFSVTGLPSVDSRRVRDDDGNLVPRKLGNAKFGIRKNKREE